MNSMAQKSKKWRILTALGGLLLVLALVLVACGGSQQSSVTPTPKPGPKPGTTLLTYRGHTGGVTGVSWSPDGKYIASVGNDATAQVWDAKTGKLLLTYRADADGSPVALAWSPDGKYIVASEFRQSTPQVNNCSVQVFDVKTGKTILTYTGHTSLVWSLSWSPDGTRIASASEDGTVQVWQAP